MVSSISKYYLCHRYNVLSMVILRLLKGESYGAKTNLENKRWFSPLFAKHNSQRSLKNWPLCYKSPTGVLLQWGVGQLHSTTGGWNAHSIKCSEGPLSGCAPHTLNLTLILQHLHPPAFSSIIIKNVPLFLYRFFTQKYILKEKYKRQWCGKNGSH